jgi:hypothetical protein
MGLLNILHDHKFNTFFSFILGIGIICLFRPICTGDECNVNKAPAEKDFDKYVYRMGGKCYAFKTEITACPPSGAIEAFQEMSATPFETSPLDSIRRRSTPILSW